MIPGDYRAQLVNGTSYMWSSFATGVPNDVLGCGPVHILALGDHGELYTVELWDPRHCILTALFVISYANRATGLSLV
jgi:hypothetical protein